MANSHRHCQEAATGGFRVTEFGTWVGKVVEWLHNAEIPARDPYEALNDTRVLYFCITESHPLHMFQ